MKIRNINQTWLSKETDSFVKHWHGVLGTATNGTVTLSVPAISGNDQKFITDISFKSNIVGASFELLDGTAFLYQMKLPLYSTLFSQSFNTPIKTSKGTNLNIKIGNLLGTVSINVSGYSVL